MLKCRIFVIFGCTLLQLFKFENLECSPEVMDYLPHNSAIKPKKSGVLAECGQTVVADNGTIQYKLNEPYDSNELCVFVIEYESGGGMARFTLESEGFSDVDQNAILISALSPLPGRIDSNIGPSNRNITVTGYGAVIYFKTKSSNGTGFKLNFMMQDVIIHGMPGLNVVYNDENASPLEIPLSTYNTSNFYYTNYFFTSGSKMLTKPDSYLKISIAVVLGNQDTSPRCYSYVALAHFQDEEPIFEQTFCNDFETELQTSGLLIVHHFHLPGRPMINGTLQWETVSAT